MRLSRSERIFDIVNVTALLLISATMIIPLVHVMAVSLSETAAVMRNDVELWPVGMNWDNYLLVLENKRFVHALMVTLFVVTVGTLLNMILTVFTSYPLSRSYFQARRFMTLFVIFTMVFQAPLIPAYLLVRDIGILDTIWALILPSALSAFNMIICITFLRSLPEELFEAARIDGMSERRIVTSIVTPLSKPILFTLLLFYAVFHWNSYYGALIYITNPDLRPLQLYIYMMLNQGETNTMLSSASQFATLDTSPQGLQMATVILATIPIVIVYPFIQKHFIKGSLVGSLKE